MEAINVRRVLKHTRPSLRKIVQEQCERVNATIIMIEYIARLSSTARDNGGSHWSTVDGDNILVTITGVPDEVLAVISRGQDLKKVDDGKDQNTVIIAINAHLTENADYQQEAFFQLVRAADLGEVSRTIVDCLAPLGESSATVKRFADVTTAWLMLMGMAESNTVEISAWNDTGPVFTRKP